MQAQLSAQPWQMPHQFTELSTSPLRAWNCSPQALSPLHLVVGTAQNQAPKSIIL